MPILKAKACSHGFFSGNFTTRPASVRDHSNDPAWPSNRTSAISWATSGEDLAKDLMTSVLSSDHPNAMAAPGSRAR